MTLDAVNKRSAIPYYLQLADILRKGILEGTFGNDALLPSERELCDTYGVSRSTVRQCMQVLKEERLIRKERGIGTRVEKSPKLEQDLLGFHNFDLQMAQKGYAASIVLLQSEIIRGPGRVQRLMQLPPNADILKVVRIRVVDDTPVFIEKIYMPYERFPGLCPEDFLLTDIFLRKLKNEYNTVLGEAKVFIEPVILDPHEREILEIEPDPAAGLMFERISQDNTGKPVALTKRVFRGDRCRHMLVLQGQ